MVAMSWLWFANGIHRRLAPAMLAFAVVWPGALRAQRPAAVALRSGLVITRSVSIGRGTYHVRAPESQDSAAIVIRGDDVVVDFRGATLDGGPPNAAPDEGAGIAIRIEGGHRVRVLNAKIRGFKVAVLARGTRDLELSNIDASYNWKPRLFSIVEHESLADWLSFHHNERDEWLRFGAAFYLADVRGGTIRHNTVEQGMNGLLMVRSDSLRVTDNDFSFNSGLGIGLYRSSDNVIAHNRIDFNVRGYSHGFYRRGQDSADLLLYEQSNRNLVAYNSATHGGDGLFLWAGQSTMDSGEGGANGNVFHGNDFSFAPANGMEATFSRNIFRANRAVGNDYGMWGGYSFESEIVDNCFERNRTGIAIEHGQQNEIRGNRFLGDTTAIRLWADSIEPSDWGYPRHRDTRSRDYRIQRNLFAGNRVRLQVAHTSGLVETDNDSLGTSSGSCAEPVATLAADELARLGTGVRAAVPSLPLTRLGRSAIVVDEWGPFDWRSPKLWPLDSSRAVPLRLAVLGPRGTWRAIASPGIASLSRRAGRTGDTIVVRPRPESVGNWDIHLEYRGASVKSPTGVVTHGGAPYRFSYGHFEPPTDWSVRFFTWSDSTDPRMSASAFATLLRGTPMLTQRATRLDYQWYRPLIRELPLAHWALEATTAISLPPGDYTLRTISDDGVRVWVDDVRVIDNWSLHESTVDHAALTGGTHSLRVQFFQVDGWTELRVDVLRGRTLSSGSPGPH
jgi:parallel beta-helix repeat protein